MTYEEALQSMRAHFKSKRQSIAFAAPEMISTHMQDLEERVESVIWEIYHGEDDHPQT